MDSVVEQIKELNRRKEELLKQLSDSRETILDECRKIEQTIVMKEAEVEQLKEEIKSLKTQLRELSSFVEFKRSPHKIDIDPNQVVTASAQVHGEVISITRKGKFAKANAVRDLKSTIRKIGLDPSEVEIHVN